MSSQPLLYEIAGSKCTLSETSDFSCADFDGTVLGRLSVHYMLTNITGGYQWYFDFLTPGGQGVHDKLK